MALPRRHSDRDLPFSKPNPRFFRPTFESRISLHKASVQAGRLHDRGGGQFLCSGPKLGSRSRLRLLRRRLLRYCFSAEGYWPSRPQGGRERQSCARVAKEGWAASFLLLAPPL